MARKQRTKKHMGFSSFFIAAIIFSFAAYGGYVLYHKNQNTVKKAKAKIIKAYNHMKKIPNLKTSKKNSKIWVCWYNPPKKVLKKCYKARTCSGVGTYATHTKKKTAMKLAYKLCIQEYGQCNLNYCER